MRDRENESESGAGPAVLPMPGFAAPDAADEWAFPDPLSRRRSPDIRGRSLNLPNGQTWLVADTGISPLVTEIRDRLHVDRTLKGQVPLADLKTVGLLGLLHNYDLTEEEAGRIILACDRTELAETIGESLFSATAPFRRTYTLWIETGLLANGLKPWEIPDGRLAGVVFQLVRTGRMLPIEEFVEADEAVAARSKLLSVQ